MNAQTLLFDPLLPAVALWGAFILGVLLIGLALWRGLAGWMWRAAAVGILLLALFNPSLQKEARDSLNDIVVLVVDQSASQQLGGRPAQTKAALAALRARVSARPHTELRVITMRDSPDDGGTLLMQALRTVLAELPRSRLAGVLLLTDGQVHDAAFAPDPQVFGGAPVHVLLTGRKADWDRRLSVTNAPAFAILGEKVVLTLRLDDQGAAPANNGRATLNISVDGAPEQVFQVPLGKEITLPITLAHGGMNVIRFTTPAVAGELTTRNNSAVVQINGVRDRLRVLLVSGQPYAGERTWRNLLKSDSSVDLVHFTILRPPEKQDGVPVRELSLIAFPVRELFMDKIDQFDLIIFDRYKLRGILPARYLDNIRSYVEKGGAVLVAAGPDFASADSLEYSALGAVLPAIPTGRVLEQGFTPTVTALGNRHPVTEGLAKFASNKTGDGPGWGRWLRQIEVTPKSGNVVMSGIGKRPLLILDRVGKGRVALLASDQAWLWTRGFEGGGPQMELLRRLAHWMMKEPELEEEALRASAQGHKMTITRRTLKDSVPDVTITAPDGARHKVTLEQAAPGRFEASYTGAAIGLYRLSDGIKSTVIALGPAAPREFNQTLATPKKLRPLSNATRGGVFYLESGVPNIREMRAGQNAAGRGWMGLVPRHAYLTVDVTRRALLPGWSFLLLTVGFSLLGWLREGRA